MTANEILKAQAAKRSTSTLLGALYILEGQSTLTDAESMTKAAISDAITERHALDTLLDEIFMDDEFTGTYTDALEIALVKVAA